MSQFDCTLRYVKGAANVEVVALSHRLGLSLYSLSSPIPSSPLMDALKEAYYADAELESKKENEKYMKNHGMWKIVRLELSKIPLTFKSFY